LTQQEIDELFFDAVENQNLVRKSEYLIDTTSQTRSILPSEKDPDAKFGIWDVIKNSIGEDISKITVPVFYNEPLSIL
jgi:oxysterol-binding protein 1